MINRDAETPFYPPYLRNVNFGSFGTRHHHGFEVVELGKGLLGGRTGFVSGFVEDFVDLILEGLTQRVTRSRLQLVVVSLLDNVNHLVEDEKEGHYNRK